MAHPAPPGALKFDPTMPFHSAGRPLRRTPAAVSVTLRPFALGVPGVEHCVL